MRANQDIIHELWLKNNLPLNDVLIEDIGKFAEEHKRQLNSKSITGVTISGLDYAVLKFILEYCISINWIKNQLLWAKDPYTGNYRYWRKYSTYKVNVSMEKIV